MKTILTLGYEKFINDDELTENHIIYTIDAKSSKKACIYKDECGFHCFTSEGAVFSNYKSIIKLIDDLQYHGILNVFSL